MKKKPRLSSKTLQAFIEELEGIDGLIPAPYTVEADIDEDGDMDFSEAHIESEEIEVALASAISTIASECRLENEPASLASLFEELFPSDGDLESSAINFEDSVNGYLGDLFGESLALAHTYLRDVIDNLRGRLDKWKSQVSLQQKLDAG